MRLNRIDYQNMTASLGYWVRKQYYKQGVASTAAMLLAGFGFEKLQFKRIEIKVVKGNIASAWLKKSALSAKVS